MADPIVIILSVQFVFDWVVTTIVAVTWSYAFRLAAPQYSNSLPAWGLYTLLMILLMPFVRMWLLKHWHVGDDQSEHDLEKKLPDGVQAKALQGSRLMLSATCGTAVGTSISGLMALLFPVWSNLSQPQPIEVFVAVGVTVVYVFWQARLERRLHLGSFPRDGYVETLLSILLMSTWGTLGFFWSIVWTRVLRHIRNWAMEPAPATFQTYLSDFLDKAAHPMRTFQDMLNGRPQAMVESMPDLCLKALITLVLALAFLLVLPDPPPLGQESSMALHLRRRGLLGAQMVMLSVAAYSVSDVGFYFGTRYVTRVVGSEQIGLAVAFIDAAFMTCLVAVAGVIHGFRPKTNLGRWLLQLGCLFVSYSWWYCWQELLFYMQGFWVNQLDCAEWVHITLRIITAVVFTGCLTLLFSYGMVTITQWQVSHAKMDQQDRNQDELAELLDKGALDNHSLRYFAACSGLLISARASEGDLSEWHRTGYGALTGESPDLS